MVALWFFAPQIRAPISRKSVFLKPVWILSPYWELFLKNVKFNVKIQLPADFKMTDGKLSVQTVVCSFKRGQGVGVAATGASIIIILLRDMRKEKSCGGWGEGEKKTFSEGELSW